MQVAKCCERQGTVARSLDHCFLQSLGGALHATEIIHVRVVHGGKRFFGHARPAAAAAIERDRRAFIRNLLFDLSEGNNQQGKNGRQTEHGQRDRDHRL